MTPNKPTTLRDELIKLLFLEIDAIASEDDYRQYILSEEEIHKLITRIEDLAVSTHSTELLSKILEEVQKSEMTPQVSGYIGVKEAKEWFYKIINQEKQNI